MDITPRHVNRQDMQRSQGYCDMMKIQYQVIVHLYLGYVDLPGWNTACYFEACTEFVAAVFLARCFGGDEQYPNAENEQRQCEAHIDLGPDVVYVEKSWHGITGTHSWKS